MTPPKPTSFKTRDAFRSWLERHHATTTELVVRLFKVHAAGRGVTYVQALDEALCFGWIDGVRRSLDSDSFTVRFTPRKPRSIWSRVNVAHVQRLIAEGRMAPSGLAAYGKREPGRTGLYSFERAAARLTPEELKLFRAQRAAWDFFAAQPPGYRRACAHWVTSAKRPETRSRRLATLIEDSAGRRRIRQLTRPTG